MPISGGEHEFGRHAFRRWAEMGCANIWQPDANRAAGITEMTKIIHLAAAHDIPVIPHGGQMHNYHLSMANINMPLGEYFPIQAELIDSNAFFWYVVEGEVTAKDGYLEILPKPGLGLELNRAAMQRYKI
jgi:L-alanine-DL-glutamate epimerase-like enolase superfamily enzyme